jgi:transcription antitermination factor NusG
MASAEFRVGEVVRILDGPFTNFVGVVRAITTAPAGLVTVGVGLQGREVPVEVDRYRLSESHDGARLAHQGLAY